MEQKNAETGFLPAYLLEIMDLTARQSYGDGSFYGLDTPEADDDQKGRLTPFEIACVITCRRLEEEMNALKASVPNNDPQMCVISRKHTIVSRMFSDSIRSRIPDLKGKIIGVCQGWILVVPRKQCKCTACQTRIMAEDLGADVTMISAVTQKKEGVTECRQTMH